jgi:hypothetical protein
MVEWADQGDYLLIVKQNQPTLQADIQQVFAALSLADRERAALRQRREGRRRCQPDTRGYAAGILAMIRDTAYHGAIA